MDTSENIVDFSSAGALADDPSSDAEWHNARLLNSTLQGLLPGQTLLLQGNFHLMGGIVAFNLSDVKIQLDGSIIFSANTKRWPRGVWDIWEHHQKKETVLECIRLVRPSNLTISSGLGVGGGTLDGTGSAWWGIPLIGYLRHAEDRPRLLRVDYGRNITVENLLLLNSPYWSTLFKAVDGLIVRHTGISSRRTNMEGHSLLDLSAFNTDGIDVSGRNVHVHDCNIWCQDDTIAVKDGPVGEDNITRISEDMLFERIQATGVGLTIGSIWNYSIVRNITFRDVYLHKPFKGVYFKFGKSNRTFIEAVLVENVIMDEPQQWPIWIGPAQQADARNPCHGNPCSLCWPLVPGADCGGSINGTYKNLTLRNISINRPLQGGGVLLADDLTPMRGVLFDGVKVKACGPLHFRGRAADAFPLLPHDIPLDYHVRIFQCGVVFLCLIVMCAAGYVARWLISHHCWRRSPLIERLASFVLWCVLVIGGLTARVVHVNLKMADPDEYYCCEGVFDGVAVGDTWPVPRCFEDQTNALSDNVDDTCPRPIWSDPDIGATVAMTFSFILGAAIVALAFFFEKHCKDGTRRHQLLDVCEDVGERSPHWGVSEEDDRYGSHFTTATQETELISINANR